MRREMKMPDLAANEAEIKIVKWLAVIGQRVQRGEPLLEVETDKATMEVESIATGTLQELCASPDQDVAVGQVIAVIEVGDPAQL